MHTGIRSSLMAIIIFLAVSGTAAAGVVVANFTSSAVTVYDYNDNGDATPLQVISGSNTLLTNSHDAFVTNGEIFVVSHLGHRVTVYNLTDSGNISPKRTISGLATGIGYPVRALVNKDEVFVTNYNSTTKVFSVNDNGNVAPKRSLDTLSCTYAVAVFGEEIFLTRHPDTNDCNRIYVFNRTDSGTAEPKRTIFGTSTGLNFAAGLFIKGSELFVGNDFGNSITVYNIGDSGDAAPKRTISGGLTQLSGPLSLAVCQDEIFVANRHSNKVTVYDITDNGNVTPKRVIAGGATQLSGPTGISLDCGVPGDLNGDGSVDLADAILASKVLSGLHVDNTLKPANSVDNDFRIGLEDFIHTLESAAELR